MKRFFCLVALLALCFCGCSVPPPVPHPGRLSVITTIFPAYDFAKQVFGGKAEVLMLLPPGVESHAYEPTAQDIIKIQNCDLFIYVGGEADAWVTRILSALGRQVDTLLMMDCVVTMEESEHAHDNGAAHADGAGNEHASGADAAHANDADAGHTHDADTDHAHDLDDTHTHEESGAPDPHVWTAPQNAIHIIEQIRDRACAIDAPNSALYQSNADVYCTQLETLHQDFSAFFQAAGHPMLLFGDRFPLRYFARAYDLEYFAAFPGCSAEGQPSAATVARLIDTAREKNIKTIFYLEFSNHQVADSIARAVSGKAALFHSCHNVSRDDLAHGVSYLSLMRQNLQTLKEAFHD